MATYLELRNLFDDGELKNRTITATVIAAQTLAAGTPTAGEIAWVALVLSNPKSAGVQAFYAVLAANKNATVGQIQSASDASLQANVDAIVPILVSALAGV